MKAARATEWNCELQRLAEQLDKCFAREQEALNRSFSAWKRGAEMSAIEDEARVHAAEARTYVEEMLALDASSMEALVAKAWGLSWCIGGNDALLRGLALSLASDVHKMRMRSLKRAQRRSQNTI